MTKSFLNYLLVFSLMTSTVSSTLYSMGGADEESQPLNIHGSINGTARKKSSRCSNIAAGVGLCAGVLVGLGGLSSLIADQVWRDANPVIVPTTAHRIPCTPCADGNIRNATVYFQSATSCDPVGAICLHATSDSCDGYLGWGNMGECYPSDYDSGCPLPGTPEPGSFENLEAFLADNPEIVQTRCPNGTMYATIMNEGKPMNATGNFGLRLRCQRSSSGLADCE